MRRFFSHLSIFLFIIFGLTACFGPVKTPPMKTYTLSADPFLQSSPSKSKNQAVLFVAPPSASPGYESNAMIYTETPHQLQQFSSHSWVAPPAEMLTPLLVANWQNTGCFRAVVPSSSLGTVNFTINTQLLALQQEINGDSSRIRVAILFTLIDSSSGEIAAIRRYEAIVPTAQNTPYAGVLAANQAIREILHKSNSFICHYANKSVSE